MRFISALPLSLSITLDYRVLLVLLVLLLLATYAVFYRFYLTKYERLPKQPPKLSGVSYDLHPDATADDAKSLPKNYAEEFLGSFLQSIKVFGYIEQPVFHELAKRLQTRKLPAGDILFYSDDTPSDDNFYVVVEGCVQVFIRSLHTDEADIDPIQMPPMGFSDNSSSNTLPNHHLLHEVQAGGNVSSLFTILSLFTEDIPVQQRAQESKHNSSSVEDPAIFDGFSVGDYTRESSLGFADHLSEALNFSTLSDNLHIRPEDAMSASERGPVFPHISGGLDDHMYEHEEEEGGPLIDNLHGAGHSRYARRSAHHTAKRADMYSASSNQHDHIKRSNSLTSASAYAARSRINTPTIGIPPLAAGVMSGITARASTDTTLVVIPAEAFIRLRNKFPHAAAHIAQVILTRFQRVTQLTMNKYLGLTHEVIKIEQNVNNATGAAMPNCSASILEQQYFMPVLPMLPARFFRPGGLNRLRRRFHMANSIYCPSSSTLSSSVAKMTADSHVSVADMNSSSSTNVHILKPLPIDGAYSSALEEAGDTVHTEIRSRGKKRTTTISDITSSVLSQRIESTSTSPSSSPLASRRASAATGLMNTRTVLRDEPRADQNVQVFDDPEEERHFRSSTYQILLNYLGLGSFCNHDDVGKSTDTDHHGRLSPSIPHTHSYSPTQLEMLNSPLPRSTSSLQAMPPPFLPNRYMLGSAGGNNSATGRQNAHRRTSNYRVPGNSPVSALASPSAPMGMPRSALGSHFGSGTSMNTISTASTAMSNISEVDESDVEIRFCLQDSVLVNVGERLPGLFLVIDGLLSVAAPPVQSVSSESRTSRLQQVSSRTANGGVSSVPDPTSAPRSGLTAAAANTMHSFTANQPPWSARPASPAAPPVDTPSAAAAAAVVAESHGTYLIRPGGIAGYLAALTGHPSLVTIRARADCCVAFISKQALDRLIDRHPVVILTLAKRLMSYLLCMRPSPLVLHIDIALDWVQVNAGQICHRQGDPSDAIYIVLNGRLRDIVEKDGDGFDIIGEYGQGESVGELEVLMETNRPSTLHAIRDTELARIPKTLFNTLAMRHPEITLSIARIIATRTHQRLDINRLSQQRINMRTSPLPDLGKNNTNLRTVALLPASRDVPIGQFSEMLRDALTLVGSSNQLLNQATVLSILGKHAFTKMGKLKLMSWLAEQEDHARVILYLADAGINSPWTQRCIRQADCILLVALGDQDSGVGEFERYLLGMKTTARKELVLLHQERFCSPGSTQMWLKNRLWIHAHHHIQMNLNRSSVLRHRSRQTPLVQLKGQLLKYYDRYSNVKRVTPMSTNLGLRSDFARLARRLCGRSIGLVLGGGGARGIAHVGFIRALEEAGIPIDMVGGTSIGSFVGGLYAREVNHVSIYGRAKSFSSRTGSLWRKLLDLTYPVTSYFTGHEFNRGIWKTFADIHIEDLWLNYFCVTTNIVHSRMEVHQSGYLWRYVRASMSLSGFLPPLSDNGNLLVDGGYLNNLPGDVMKGLGAELVIMVDVAAEDDTSPVYFGDSLSGWWVILNRINPFRRGAPIPNLAEIQSRLAYVSCIRQLEEAKNLSGCFYLRPPVTHFGTLDFGKFDAIYNAGYEFGKQQIANWAKHGQLELFTGRTNPATEIKTRRGRRNSI